MTRADVQDYVTDQLDGDKGIGSVRAVTCDDGLPATEGSITNCLVDSSELSSLPVSVSVVRDEHGKLVISLVYGFLS